MFSKILGKVKHKKDEGVYINYNFKFGDNTMES